VTTYYPFVPSPRQAPSFMPTLDGNQYNITVIWNVSSRRFYIQCKDLSGNLIFFVPLSETKSNNPLISLSYDSQNTRVIATTRDIIYYGMGSSFNVSIINTIPSGYNGSGMASVLNANQFFYPLSLGNYPGPATTLGSADVLISLCKGYFNSTLIYRNQVFEVNP
jgi:hypothetical protein